MHTLQGLVDKTSLVARCECPIQRDSCRKLLQEFLPHYKLVFRASNGSKLHIFDNSLQHLDEMLLQTFLLNELLLSTTLKNLQIEE